MYKSDSTAIFFLHAMNICKDISSHIRFLLFYCSLDFFSYFLKVIVIGGNVYLSILKDGWLTEKKNKNNYINTLSYKDFIWKYVIIQGHKEIIWATFKMTVSHVSGGCTLIWDNHYNRFDLFRTIDGG